MIKSIIFRTLTDFNVIRSGFSNKDQDDFKIGYTIVTLSKENGRKVIIERTATDIKVREDLPVF